MIEYPYPKRHEFLEVDVDGETVLLSISLEAGAPAIDEKTRDAFEDIARAAARALVRSDREQAAAGRSA